MLWALLTRSFSIGSCWWPRSNSIFLVTRAISYYLQDVKLYSSKVIMDIISDEAKAWLELGIRL